MKKGLILFLILLNIFLLISCSGEVIVEDESDENIILSEISIIFTLPEAMEVGELIKGGYTIENTGEEFEALIITSVSTEDKKNDCIGKSKRINFKDTTGLLFGIYYDSGITNCQQKWYKLAGKYVYEIYLFDCKDITEIEGECDTSVDIDDIINKLEPLAYDKHELTVTGNDWASECEIDEDCTSTCENCDLGTYECNNGMCMECSSFVDCNDGFRCSDYVCVEMG